MKDNDRFDVEFRVVNRDAAHGNVSAHVERQGVSGGELATALPLMAHTLNQLLGAIAPEVSLADTTQRVRVGQTVKVRLGTTSDGASIVERQGQLTLDPMAKPAGKACAVRLVPPLNDIELAAMSAGGTDRAAQARHAVLTTLASAAGLPTPMMTPAQEAETERALVTALRNWRSAQRMNGTQAESTGYDWVINRIREIIMSINDVGRDFGRTMADIAELVGLTVERQADQWPVRFIRPDDLDITMSPLEDIRHTVKGELDDPATHDASRLADIATSLGLKVERDEQGNPVNIVESRPVTS